MVPSFLARFRSRLALSSTFRRLPKLLLPVIHHHLRTSETWSRPSIVIEQLRRAPCGTAKSRCGIPTCCPELHSWPIRSPLFFIRSTHSTICFRSRGLGRLVSCSEHYWGLCSRLFLSAVLAER